MRAPRFNSKAIGFLRGLKRHNNREWFNARKAQYEELVRAPMLEVVARLAVDFQKFAPELTAGPKSLLRLYRDTRFSEDKSPYKTHVSAVFPNRQLPKLGGAGLYMEVTPGWVWVGGGMHAPDTPLLHQAREHIALNFRRFRS